MTMTMTTTDDNNNSQFLALNYEQEADHRPTLLDLDWFRTQQGRMEFKYGLKVKGKTGKLEEFAIFSFKNSQISTTN